MVQPEKRSNVNGLLPKSDCVSNCAKNDLYVMRPWGYEAFSEIKAVLIGVLRRLSSERVDRIFLTGWIIPLAE